MHIRNFKNNNLLSNCQHGFYTQHCTESAILEFITNVYQLLDDKHYAVGIYFLFIYFFLLIQSFDALNHDFFFYHKLARIVVKGILLQLFQSYIDSRTQDIYCYKEHLISKYISRDVLQGSDLGSHFISYIQYAIQGANNIPKQAYLV